MATKLLFWVRPTVALMPDAKRAWMQQRTDGNGHPPEIARALSHMIKTFKNHIWWWHIWISMYCIDLSFIIVILWKVWCHFWVICSRLTLKVFYLLISIWSVELHHSIQITANTTVRAHTVILYISLNQPFSFGHTDCDEISETLDWVYVGWCVVKIRECSRFFFLHYACNMYCLF